MGEISEMMMEGTLCQGCGVFMGEAGDGFPRSCPDCAQLQRACHSPPAPKVLCPTCGKKVKAAGLADHQRDAHGAENRKFTEQ